VPFFTTVIIIVVTSLVTLLLNKSVNYMTAEAASFGCDWWDSPAVVGSGTWYYDCNNFDTYVITAYGSAQVYVRDRLSDVYLTSGSPALYIQDRADSVTVTGGSPTVVVSSNSISRGIYVTSSSTFTVNVQGGSAGLVSVAGTSNFQATMSGGRIEGIILSSAPSVVNLAMSGGYISYTGMCLSIAGSPASSLSISMGGSSYMTCSVAGIFINGNLNTPSFSFVMTGSSWIQAGSSHVLRVDGSVAAGTRSISWASGCSLASTSGSIVQVSSAMNSVSLTSAATLSAGDRIIRSVGAMTSTTISFTGGSVTSSSNGVESTGAASSVTVSIASTSMTSGGSCVVFPSTATTVRVDLASSTLQCSGAYGVGVVGAPNGVTIVGASSTINQGTTQIYFGQAVPSNHLVSFTGSTLSTSGSTFVANAAMTNAKITFISCTITAGATNFDFTTAFSGTSNTLSVSGGRVVGGTNFDFPAISQLSLLLTGNAVISSTSSNNANFVSITTSSFQFTSASFTSAGWNFYVTNTMSASGITFSGSGAAARAASGFLYVGSTTSAVGVVITTSAVVSVQSSAGAGAQISLVGVAQSISITIGSASFSSRGDGLSLGSTASSIQTAMLSATSVSLGSGSYMVRYAGAQTVSASHTCLSTPAYNVGVRTTSSTAQMTISYNGCTVTNQGAANTILSGSNTNLAISFVGTTISQSTTSTDAFVIGPTNPLNSLYVASSSINGRSVFSLTGSLTSSVVTVTGSTLQAETGGAVFFGSSASLSIANTQFSIIGNSVLRNGCFGWAGPISTIGITMNPASCMASTIGISVGGTVTDVDVFLTSSTVSVSSSTAVSLGSGTATDAVLSLVSSQIVGGGGDGIALPAVSLLTLYASGSTISATGSSIRTLTIATAGVTLLSSQLFAGTTAGCANLEHGNADTYTLRVVNTAAQGFQNLLTDGLTTSTVLISGASSAFTSNDDTWSSNTNNIISTTVTVDGASFTAGGTGSNFDWTPAQLKTFELSIIGGATLQAAGSTMKCTASATISSVLLSFAGATTTVSAAGDNFNFVSGATISTFSVSIFGASIQSGTAAASRNFFWNTPVVRPLTITVGGSASLTASGSGATTTHNFAANAITSLAFSITGSAALSSLGNNLDATTVNGLSIYANVAAVTAAGTNFNVGVLQGSANSISVTNCGTMYGGVSNFATATVSQLNVVGVSTAFTALGGKNVAHSAAVTNVAHSFTSCTLQAYRNFEMAGTVATFTITLSSCMASNIAGFCHVTGSSAVSAMSILITMTSTVQAASVLTNDAISLSGTVTNFAFSVIGSTFNAGNNVLTIAGAANTVTAYLSGASVDSNGAGSYFVAYGSTATTVTHQFLASTTVRNGGGTLQAAGVASGVLFYVSSSTVSATGLRNLNFGASLTDLDVTITGASTLTAGLDDNIYVLGALTDATVSVVGSTVLNNDASNGNFMRAAASWTTGSLFVSASTVSCSGNFVEVGTTLTSVSTMITTSAAVTCGSGWVVGGAASQVGITIAASSTVKALTTVGISIAGSSTLVSILLDSGSLLSSGIGMDISKTIVTATNTLTISMVSTSVLSTTGDGMVLGGVNALIWYVSASSITSTGSNFRSLGVLSSPSMRFLATSTVTSLGSGTWNVYHAASVTGQLWEVTGTSTFTCALCTNYGHAIASTTAVVSITGGSTVTGAVNMYYSGTVSGLSFLLSGTSTQLKSTTNGIVAVNGLTSCGFQILSSALFSTAGSNWLLSGTLITSTTVSILSSSTVTSSGGNNAMFLGTDVKSTVVTVASATLRSGSVVSSANIGFDAAAVVSTLTVTFDVGATVSSPGGLGNVYVGGIGNALTISAVGATLNTNSVTGANFRFAGTVSALNVFLTSSVVSSKGLNLVALTITGAAVNTVTISNSGTVIGDTGNVMVQGLASLVTISVASTSLTCASGDTFSFAQSTNLAISLVSSSITATAGRSFFVNGNAQTVSVDLVTTQAKSGTGFFIMGGNSPSTQLTMNIRTSSTIFAPTVVGLYHSIVLFATTTCTISVTGSTFLASNHLLNVVGAANAVTIVGTTAVLSTSGASSSILWYGASVTNAVHTIASTSVVTGGDSVLGVAAGSPVSNVGLTCTGSSTLTAAGKNVNILATSSTQVTITSSSCAWQTTTSHNIYFSSTLSNFLLDLSSTTVTALGAAGSAFLVEGPLSQSTVNVGPGTSIYSGSNSAALASTSTVSICSILFDTGSTTSGGGVLDISGVTTSSTITARGATCIGRTSNAFVFGGTTSVTIAIAASSLVSSTGASISYSAGSPLSSSTLVTVASSSLTSTGSSTMVLQSGNLITIVSSSSTIVAPVNNFYVQSGALTNSALTISGGRVDSSGGSTISLGGSSVSTLTVLFNNAVSMTSVNGVWCSSILRASSFTITGNSVLTHSGSSLRFVGVEFSTSSISVSGATTDISAAGPNFYSSSALISSISVSLINAKISSSSAANIGFVGATTISGYTITATSGVTLLATAGRNIDISGGSILGSRLVIDGITTVTASGGNVRISASGAMNTMTIVATSCGLTATGAASSNIEVLGSSVSGLSLSMTVSSFQAVGTNVGLGIVSSSTILANQLTLSTGGVNVAAVGFVAPSTTTVTVTNCGTWTAPSGNFQLGNAASIVMSLISTVLTATTSHNFGFTSLSQSTVTLTQSTLRALAGSNLLTTGTVTSSTLVWSALTLSASGSNLRVDGAAVSVTLTTASSVTLTSASHNVQFSAATTTTAISIASSRVTSTGASNIAVSGTATTFAATLQSCTVAGATANVELAGAVAGASIVVPQSSLTASSNLYFSNAASLYSSVVVNIGTASSLTGTQSNIRSLGAVDNAMWSITASTVVASTDSNFYFGNTLSSSTVSITATGLTNNAVSGNVGHMFAISQSIASTSITVLSCPAVTIQSAGSLLIVGSSVTSSSLLVSSSSVTTGTVLSVAGSLTSVGITITNSAISAQNAGITVAGSSGSSQVVLQLISSTFSVLGGAAVVLQPFAATTMTGCQLTVSSSSISSLTESFLLGSVSLLTMVSTSSTLYASSSVVLGSVGSASDLLVSIVSGSVWASSGAATISVNGASTRLSLMASAFSLTGTTNFHFAGGLSASSIRLVGSGTLIGTGDTNMVVGGNDVEHDTVSAWGGVPFANWPCSFEHVGEHSDQHHCCANVAHLDPRSDESGRVLCRHRQQRGGAGSRPRFVHRCSGEAEHAHEWNR
jgi:hypothetical protein